MRNSSDLNEWESCCFCIYNRKSISVIVIICEKKKLLADLYFTIIIIILFTGIIILFGKLSKTLCTPYRQPILRTN